MDQRALWSAVCGSGLRTPSIATPSVVWFGEFAMEIRSGHLAHTRWDKVVLRLQCFTIEGARAMGRSLLGVLTLGAVLFVAGCGSEDSAGDPLPPASEKTSEGKKGGKTSRSNTDDTSPSGTGTEEPAPPTSPTGLTCPDDAYDLDANEANGCEAHDARSDTPGTAVEVELAQGTASVTQEGQVYSDSRPHAAAPESRTNGLPDWYKLVAKGDGGKTLSACLSITNFPADNLYEICIGKENQADFETQAPTCKMVSPTTDPKGNDRCVSPSGSAPPEQGTYYIRISKQSGANTPNKYGLYVQH
jgi:hypothetical protein